MKNKTYHPGTQSQNIPPNPKAYHPGAQSENIPPNPKTYHPVPKHKS